MKLYFRYITMPKQHYRYSYAMIDIFQKLCNYYAPSNNNFEEIKNITKMSDFK